MWKTFRCWAADQIHYHWFHWNSLLLSYQESGGTAWPRVSPELQFHDHVQLLPVFLIIFQQAALALTTTTKTRLPWSSFFHLECQGWDFPGTQSPVPAPTQHLGEGQTPHLPGQSCCFGVASRVMLQPGSSQETLLWPTLEASTASLAFSGGNSSRLTSDFAVSFPTLDVATSFTSGFAGAGSAGWLWAMAGAEVGRGLRSGVITATAEDGGQTGTRFRAGNFSKH